MTDRDPEVKYIPPGEPGGPLLVLWYRCLDFVDEHPRVGWYIAGMTTLNLLVNLLDLFA